LILLLFLDTNLVKDAMSNRKYTWKNLHKYINYYTYSILHVAYFFFLFTCFNFIRKFLSFFLLVICIVNTLYQWIIYHDIRYFWYFETIIDECLLIMIWWENINLEQLLKIKMSNLAKQLFSASASPAALEKKNISSFGFVQ